MSDIIDILNVIDNIQLRNININGEKGKFSKLKNPGKYEVKQQLLEKIRKDYDILRNLKDKSPYNIILSINTLNSPMRESLEIIRNTKNTYYINDKLETISFKELFEISDKDYEQLNIWMKHMENTINNKFYPDQDTKKFFEQINIVFNFVLAKKPLATPPDLPREPDYYAAYIADNGEIKCGKNIPVKSSQKRKTIKDCMDDIGDSITLYYFENDDISRLILNFWENKDQPQLEEGDNMKDVTKEVYCNYYLDELKKITDDGAKPEIEKARKMIQFYCGITQPVQTKTAYDYTVYYKEGKPLCGNRFEPKKDQQTFKTEKECKDAIDKGKFGFKDQKIAELIEQFWNNKVPPTLKGKKVDIVSFADDYIKELEKLKQNANTKEIEIASNLIKYYKDKFKYVIVKGTSCIVVVPYEGQEAYNTFKECLDKIKGSTKT